jgi:hypothetical protein
VNSQIEGIRDIVGHDDAFMALVFPSVLRQVLHRMLLTEATDPEGGGVENWPAMWRRFVKKFYADEPPDLPPPDSGEDDEYQLQAAAWIDGAVKSFCSYRKVREQFVAARQEEA